MATLPTDVSGLGSSTALPDAPPPPPADLPSLASSMGISFLSLLIVCAAAYLMLRWVSRRTSGVPRDSGPLRVLARQSLDPKRSVFVIEAAERCFLVGAGEGAMSLIAELDRDVMARELAPKAPSRAPGGFSFGGLARGSQRFGEVLARVLRRPTAAATVVREPDQPVAVAPALRGSPQAEAVDDPRAAGEVRDVPVISAASGTRGGLA